MGIRGGEKQSRSRVGRSRIVRSGAVSDDRTSRPAVPADGLGSPGHFASYPQWELRPAMPAENRRKPVRADASAAQGPTTRWEITHQGFGGDWYRLGTAEGSNPMDALESWIETRIEKHGAPLTGTY